MIGTAYFLRPSRSVKKKRDRLMRAYRSGKVFKLEDSFIFAAQIPDNSVGISGSRCSFCDNEVAYCHQVCKKCKLPFIGPFGILQITTWEKLNVEEKRNVVAEVFKDYQKSRVEYAGVPQVPLRLGNVVVVENLEGWQAHSFQDSHGIAPKNIRQYLSH